MKKIGQYSEVAVLAVRVYGSRESETPNSAWDKAANQVLRTDHSRAKSCPRTTFLTLCQEGRVLGIPSGHYTARRENYEHAMKAIALLEADPELAAKGPSDLWRLVIGNGPISHNRQMDVVLGLWRAALIVGDGEPRQ